VLSYAYRLNGIFGNVDLIFYYLYAIEELILNRNKEGMFFSTFLSFFFFRFAKIIMKKNE
jgi:hypothetical protein